MKNTVIGKVLNAERRVQTTEWRSARVLLEIEPVVIRDPRTAVRRQKGFSLLELMIAMFIMIILLSVAVPTYQRSVQHARETVLRENLWQIRRAIDQYAADKGKMPESVEALVEAKYLRETPQDPVSEKREWDEIKGEDTNTPDAQQGLRDVKSLAEGEDSEGKPYKDY